MLWIFQGKDADVMGSSLEGVFKFNVDGGAKGKPRQTGTRGVLHSSQREVLMLFSKHIVVKESNEAEVMAILEAIQMFVLY